jgi:hypothetical protein
MKISKEDFESMRKKYEKEVKQGKPAKDKKGKDKTDQTNWIFFDRETLERLLSKADPDPKKGGIQFYFTEYTAEIAEKHYPNDAEQLTGALTLVLRPEKLENETISPTVEEEDYGYENFGRMCPPFCDPSPTSNI